MRHHSDNEVNAAMIALLDALCSHERDSGRGSTIILVPHIDNEKVSVAINGKPSTGEKSATPHEITAALHMAYGYRPREKDAIIFLEATKIRT